ncbi:MAG: prolyl-tRNA synthetase associated domain-containing protein [Desulfovibrionaceae bacterium]|nr:prolyl-tRNA synthetase associated domain-containing protein [Desulfovibrionaceae bacterium]
MLDAARVLDLLRERGIVFHLYEHQAVDNAQAAADVRALMAGVICKSLFLRGKDGSLWLVTVPLDARVDLKTLGRKLGCGRLAFGDADAMMRHLGVRPGSVTPLAVLNDARGAVRLVMDEGLFSLPLINVHPLRNTMSVDIDPHSVAQLAAEYGHEPLRLAGIRADILPDG